MDRTTGRYKKQATVNKYQQKNKSTAQSKQQKEESAVAERRKLNKIERSETTKADLKKEDRSSTFAQNRADRIYDQAVRGRGQEFMESAERAARKEGLDWVKMRGRFMKVYNEQAKQITTKNTARNQGVKGKSKREGIYDIKDVPPKLRQLMRNIHNSEKGAKKASPKAYEEAKIDREYKSMMNPKAREPRKAGNVNKAGNLKDKKLKPGGLLDDAKKRSQAEIRNKQFENQKMFVDNMIKKGKSPAEIKRMMDQRILQYKNTNRKFRNEVDLERLRVLSSKVAQRLRKATTTAQRKEILKAYQQRITKIISEGTKAKRMD